MTHNILVRKIQLPLRIDLDAEMDRLQPLGGGTPIVSVPLELQAGATEALLRLEDGVVADGDLEGLVSVAVEAGGGGGVTLGELDDGAPLEPLALDVVRVEGRRAAAVEAAELQGGRDAPVEDDGALGVGAPLVLRDGGRGDEGGAQESEEG